MGAIFHNGDYVGSVPPIDDSSVSDKTLWSSQKTKEEIDAVGSMFDSLTYKTTGLSSSKATIANGGYCVVGKLVIMNIRLTTTASVSGGDIILSGLPTPPTGSNHVVASSAATNYSGYINADGNLIINTTSLGSGNGVFFSATYLTS